MTKLRAAVVGCGRIGSLFSEQARLPGVHSHAEAYLKHSRTDLVAVCDSNPGQLSRAAKRWSISGYTSLEQLLHEQRPDLVSICTPDGLHVTQARTILDAGGVKGLLMEKPLAVNAKEGADLVRRCRRTGVALTVNHTRRFSPGIRKLKQELDAGRHGELVLARFVYGKGLLHNGTHALDLLRFLFGEPSRLRLTGARREPGGGVGHDVELQWKSGGRALLTSFPEATATVFEGDFMLEKSRWRFELGGTRWSFYKRRSAMFKGYVNYVEAPRPDHSRFFAEPLQDCLFNAVDNLVRHLDRGEPLWCTGEDGLAVLRQVERLLRSK